MSVLRRLVRIFYKPRPDKPGLYALGAYKPRHGLGSTPPPPRRPAANPELTQPFDLGDPR